MEFLHGASERGSGFSFMVWKERMYEERTHLPCIFRERETETQGRKHKE